MAKIGYVARSGEGMVPLLREGRRFSVFLEGVGFVQHLVCAQCGEYLGEFFDEGGVYAQCVNPECRLEFRVFRAERH